MRRKEQRIEIRIFFRFLLALYLSAISLATLADETLDLSKLNQRGFDAKLDAVRELAESPDLRVDPLLQGLIDGTVYAERRTDRIVFATPLDGEPGYLLRDALDSEDTWEVGRRGAKRIGINNQIRGEIRNLLALRQLNSQEIEVRRASAANIIDDGDPSALQLLLDQADKETDTEVIRQIDLARLILALKSTDEPGVVAALAEAGSVLHPRVVSEVSRLASLQTSVGETAKRIQSQQQSRLKAYENIQLLFFGLSLGSVLVLAAIGLSITFGVMGVINMAHGELIMLGAYTTYVVQQWLPASPGVALLLSIPLAFVVSGGVGIMIERGVVRFLYDRPLETLLATFGVSLILQQAVRSIFSPLNRTVVSPEWMSGSIEITMGLTLTANRVFIFGFALFLFALLWLLINRTRFGLEVRAVMQNREMASAMGIRSRRVDMLTFGLGSGVAGIAGVALSQITNVGPNLGQSYIIDSFMVVVFGGVGSLWGTLVGGLSIGIANKLLEPELGAVTAKIVLLVLIILFIQARPKGLFPQKGRVQ